jgi:hypothetical protein
MVLPLMPKATAVWLIENTTLSFEQIAEFCGMHPLEVQGIADDDVAIGIVGQDPVASGQITREMLEACEQDPEKKLRLAEKAREYLKTSVKGSRYTPRARRQDKPEAVAWLLKHHPYVPDSKIIKLIGTTKKTIEAIRSRTHWNINNIQAKDPVLLGLCSQTLLEEIITATRPAAEKHAADAVPPAA